MNHPDTHTTPAEGMPRLRPYQFIATPAITLVLDAIAERLAVGESFAPGVRALAGWAGLRSAGQISPILYQLAADGWIAYDSAGTITLLLHPDQEADRLPDHDPDRGDQNGDRGDQDADPSLDHSPDRPDQGCDRPPPIRRLVESSQRVPKRSARTRCADQAADRLSRCMVLEIHEQQQQHAPAAARKNLPFMAQTDQAADRLCPAARALADLGAHEQIIAEALAARPGLTDDEVRGTWAWHAARRARSGGRLGEGVFFHAIRRGQIHAPPERESAGGVIDVSKYTSGAYGDLFRRGGDVDGLEGWTTSAPYASARPPSLAQPLGVR